MQTCTGCSCRAFFCCVSSNVASIGMLWRMCIRTGYIYVAFLQYESSCWDIVAFFAFETVCHHVFHQIYFIRGFKITLVAFVEVLLLVCYQVNLQSTLKGKYILTLVTLKEFLFAFFFRVSWACLV